MVPFWRRNCTLPRCSDLSSLRTGNIYIYKLRWYPQQRGGIRLVPPLRNLRNTCRTFWNQSNSLKLSKPSRSLQYRATMSFKRAKTCQIPPQRSGPQAFQTPPEPFNTSGTLWIRELICVSVLVCHSISLLGKNAYIKRKDYCKKWGKLKALTTFWCCDMSKAKQRIFWTQVLPSLRAEQTQQISQDCFGPHCGRHFSTLFSSFFWFCIMFLALRATTCSPVQDAKHGDQCRLWYHCLQLGSLKLSQHNQHSNCPTSNQQISILVFMRKKSRVKPRDVPPGFPCKVLGYQHFQLSLGILVWVWNEGFATKMPLCSASWSSDLSDQKQKAVTKTKSMQVRFMWAPCSQLQVTKITT